MAFSSEICEKDTKFAIDFSHNQHAARKVFSVSWIHLFHVFGHFIGRGHCLCYTNALNTIQGRVDSQCHRAL